MLMMELARGTLNISAWNSRGLGAAAPYLDKLMKTADVLCVSEHQLYECELGRLNQLHHDFTGYGKSSTSLKPENYGKVPGHCGVAILWNKALSPCIRPLQTIGTDRFCAVEVLLDQQRPLYIQCGHDQVPTLYLLCSP